MKARQMLADPFGNRIIAGSPPPQAGKQTKSAEEHEACSRL